LAGQPPVEDAPRDRVRDRRPSEIKMAKTLGDEAEDAARVSADAGAVDKPRYAESAVLGGDSLEKTRNGSVIKAMEKTGVALTADAEQLRAKELASSSTSSNAKSACCSVQ